MSKYKFAAIVLVYSLTLTACGGGGVGIVSLPPGASITGLVADTRGGPPLSGATVAIEGTARSATTDANGAFSFAGVTPGTYNFLMTRSGYGAGKVQGVVVAGSTATEVSAHLRRALDSTKPIGAPTIAVSGLPPGATVSGIISFTISVTAPNPVRFIQVRFGQRGDVGSQVFEDSVSATVTWNTSLNANGSSFVNILAYDNNYNLAEWTIAVTINNGPSGSPPGAPGSVFASAFTFGRPLNVLQAQREAMARAGRLLGTPGRLALQSGRSINIQAAPADSTLFVYILWSPVAGATGYKIYRSLSSGGPFSLLADARTGIGAACFNIAFAGMTQCHRDSSPQLAAGTSVFYRVTAYTTAGESPQSATASTTPTGVFNLNLSSPIDEATGISPGGIGTQTFTYAPTSGVGTVQHYQGYIGGVNDPRSAWWFFCVNNSTTITYGTQTCSGAAPAVDLQRAKRYEWDVAYAYAYTRYGAGEAFSIAGFASTSSPLTSSSGSLNGPFRFTTAP